MSHHADWGGILSSAPKNCWLAFDKQETRVISFGDTIEEVIEKARQLGESDPVLFWCPEVLAPRIF